jgi:signal transduction histidine kinase
VTLAIAFSLTIASFLGSTAIAEQEQQAIEAEAEEITASAVPGSEIVANARAELRHVDEALDDIMYRGAMPDTLDDERAALHGHLEQYRALPDYPGEAELVQQTTEREVAMEASIARFLELTTAGDRHAAGDELTTHTRPALRHLVDSLRVASEINLQAAADSAGEIRRLRRSSSALRIFLNAASALSAATAAFVVVRMARRFVAVTDERLEEMDRFAGRVAHDIRSPLNTVNLALELARRSPNLDGKTQSILDRGTRTLSRVDQLIDALLGFARAGKPDANAIGTRIGDVLPSLIEDMRRGAEDKGIVLDGDVPPHAAEACVTCSPGVLLSIVSNLVGNALKYMGDAPTRHVGVHAIEQARVVRIEVEDSGPGVPPELLTTIFDPYTRAEHGGSIPGLGLGLATVRRLAEAHGGSCGVESTLGVGSLFWVELPRCPARGAAPLLAPA